MTQHTNGNSTHSGHTGGKAPQSNGANTSVSRAPSVSDGYTQVQEDDRPIMLTGGAGFIGTNVAQRLLEQGRRVIVYDNLSREGVRNNLQWLVERYGERVLVEVADVRDVLSLRRYVAKAAAVFHFAAQVAVTSSLVDPVEDFMVNARGTVNVLEALRALDNPPPLFFTSTNKVYGGLEDLEFRKAGRRYEPSDPQIRENGISEARRLDFHSPYGCSKGTADQYVLDYARTFGIKAVVFRMSCIYGPHQFGTEDQGWVAHFLIRALQGEPITLYGDGLQVRDILFVEDLVNAFMLALKNIDSVSGQAFNMGGGRANAVSLLEILELIGQIHGERPQISFGGWRPGDQRYYVSDTNKFSQVTGWKAQVGVREGVSWLYNWLLVYRARTAQEKGVLQGAWSSGSYLASVNISEVGE